MNTPLKVAFLMMPVFSVVSSHVNSEPGAPVVRSNNKMEHVLVTVPVHRTVELCG